MKTLAHLLAATLAVVPAGAAEKFAPLPLAETVKIGSGGLVAKDGELKGFVIAGEDKHWVKAAAKIEGNKVIVSSPNVPKPAAVRYAWENNPDCNLYNGAGQPSPLPPRR